MNAPKTPKPPPGLKKSGKALWTEVQAEYELEEHERGLLLEMCRTVDALDGLFVLVERDGLQDAMTGKVNPALIEARQLRIAFARMAAALRLPAGDAGDPAANRRPQRRVGVRGTYGIRGAVS